MFSDSVVNPKGVVKVGRVRIAGCLAGGPVYASQPGAHFTGHHVVVPTQGDCVSTPVTEALTYLVGSFSG